MEPAQILIQRTRNVVFYCMILVAAYVLFGPIKRVGLILSNDQNRRSRHLATIHHEPPFLHQVDDQGQDTYARAIKSGYYALPHFIPAIIWIPLWPLQFMPNIRMKYPAFHRSLGTFLFTIASILMLSPFMLCHTGGCYRRSTHSIYYPLSAFFEPPFFALAYPYAGLAFIKSYLHAKARQIREHRQWMLRLIAVYQGVFLVRPVINLMAVVYKNDPRATRPDFQFDRYWLTMAICAFGSVVVIEIWILIEKMYKMDGVQRYQPKSKSS